MLHNDPVRHKEKNHAIQLVIKYVSDQNGYSFNYGHVNTTVKSVHTCKKKKVYTL